MKTSYKVNSILKVGASMFANRRKNSSYLPDSDGLTNPIFYSRLAKFRRSADTFGTLPFSFIYPKEV